MCMYIDSNEDPAYRFSFGWSLVYGSTSLVMGVRNGRVELFRIPTSSFEAEYAATSAPAMVAVRALESMGRSLGMSLNARALVVDLLQPLSWRSAALYRLVRARDVLTGGKYDAWAYGEGQGALDRLPSAHGSGA